METRTEISSITIDKEILINANKEQQKSINEWNACFSLVESDINKFLQNQTLENLSEWQLRLNKVLVQGNEYKKFLETQGKGIANLVTIIKYRNLQKKKTQVEIEKYSKAVKYVIDYQDSLFYKKDASYDAQEKEKKLHPFIVSLITDCNDIERSKKVSKISFIKELCFWCVSRHKEETSSTELESSLVEDSFYIPTASMK